VNGTIVPRFCHAEARSCFRAQASGTKNVARRSVLLGANGAPSSMTITLPSNVCELFHGEKDSGRACAEKRGGALSRPTHRGDENWLLRFEMRAGLLQSGIQGLTGCRRFDLGFGDDFHGGNIVAIYAVIGVFIGA
jgi:hypothetical protein